MKIQWVKWKSHQGAKSMGNLRYNPPEPWTVWDKVLGVVARCEGNHDTVVSYDGTGITWGFQQWTFTSGRLQKLLESFKSIPDYDFEEEREGTLFDSVCRIKGDRQVFVPFGFKITGGQFVDIMGDSGYKVLRPQVKAQKKRIDDICMGRTIYTSFKKQKDHALRLARLFSDMAHEFGVPEAQVHFAKTELKRQMRFKRPPLGNIGTIEQLLTDTWETPAPALFFNLWQNHPAATYRLFKKVYAATLESDDMWDFFELAWKKTCRSKFGNWGFGKPENKSPRVKRIKKAMKEFYDLDLKYVK